MKISYIILFLVFSIVIGHTQGKDKRVYIFGHSLLDHRPPIDPVTPDETTVPHWMYLLAEHSGHTYGATGQYGFLRSHANLPPGPQWGYAEVPGVWDTDFQPLFGQANLYNVIITAANFVQNLPPTVPYDDGIEDGLTPVSATETIVDWLGTQEDDSLNIFIYENWPEMGSFLANGWPATEAEYDSYNTYLRGDFHSWWIDYYNALTTTRPNANIKMIPVGPIIADLSDGLLSNIPVAEYYEDADPHGRPNIYFLAGLITYMAIYEEMAPLDFQIPSSISTEISSNFSAVVNFIWTELNNFTDADGNNIVFANPLSQPPQGLVSVENSALFIEDDAGIILKGRDGNCYNIFVDANGDLMHESVTCPN